MPSRRSLTRLTQRPLAPANGPVAKAPDHWRGLGASWLDDDHSRAGNTRRTPFPSQLPPGPDVLRWAAAAYLGRFKGLSRRHSASDLTVFLTWCASHGLDPLGAGRADLERYVRWVQETRAFKPSTVARRVSVVAGFYRTAVIDDLLDHSPAEHLRRPRVPPDSPTVSHGGVVCRPRSRAAKGPAQLPGGGMGCGLPPAIPAGCPP